MLFLSVVRLNIPETHDGFTMIDLVQAKLVPPQNIKQVGGFRFVHYDFLPVFFNSKEGYFLEEVILDGCGYSDHAIL